MSKVVLPYILREGQIAYASRVMANLQAITAKINQVSVPGIPDSDIEQALRELKNLIDIEAKAAKRSIASFDYDSEGNMLIVRLVDGALFEISMERFINDYQGSQSGVIQTFVDGNRRIHADIKEGSISYQLLSQALQTLIDNKVTAAVPGNASQIRFADGSTMQEKLDTGDLHGKDGVAVALDAMYYFRVGANGHLYLGVADGAGQPPFNIDERGHLLYTID